MTLRIGWWDHFEQQQGIPLAQQYDERLNLLKRAEGYGFYGYHVAEHHLTPLDMAPSPLVFLTAAARETSTIRLGSLVLVLPLYNPVRLVQELCMVDNLSHGRLMPGVGRGVRDVEHEWFGHAPEEARERFQETFEVLRQTLASDEFDHTGKHHSYEHLPTNFTSYQKPMRFWYAGNLRGAADGAMNVIGVGDREAYDYFAETWAAKRASGDPAYQGEEPIAGSTRRIVIAETDEEAAEIAERAWVVYQSNFRATSLRLDGGPGPAAPDWDAEGSPARRGGVIFGSPQTVRDVLRESMERLGPNHTYFAPAFQWGDLSHQEARRTMDLFAEHVMPALTAVHTNAAV